MNIYICEMDLCWRIKKAKQTVAGGGHQDGKVTTQKSLIYRFLEIFINTAVVLKAFHWLHSITKVGSAAGMWRDEVGDEK